ADLIVRKHHDKLDGEAAVLFGFIQNSTNQLQKMLAGLRDYFRAVSPHGVSRLCDSEMLLAAALGAIQPAIEESGALITHDPLPELFCDADQLVYTFSALIGNAIKFRGDAQPMIHVSATLRDRAWEFSVRDNGIGIDPRNSERVFGVFKRLNQDQFDGIGIGLPNVRRIIEQGGGRIWAESQPGHGSM